MPGIRRLYETPDADRCPDCEHDNRRRQQRLVVRIGRKIPMCVAIISTTKAAPFLFLEVSVSTPRNDRNRVVVDPQGHRMPIVASVA